MDLRLMAMRGMFATTDSLPLLAGRGIDLSPSQVYRLVTERPERLNLAVLMALMDLLVSLREGIRCCARCWAKSRTARCAHCRRDRPVGGHDGEGRAVCVSCRQMDPLHHRAVTAAGRSASADGAPTTAAGCARRAAPIPTLCARRVGPGGRVGSP